VKELLERARKDYEATRRPTPLPGFHPKLKRAARLRIWRVHRELMRDKLKSFKRLASVGGR
jgi:hypothetical protein